MASAKRYFINSLSDYITGESVRIQHQQLKQHCVDVVKHIFAKQGNSFRDCDGGLYVGVAGVSYMCYYLSQLQSFSEEKKMFLKNAEEYLSTALAYAEQPKIQSDKSMQFGFLLGNGGVYTVAALLFDALGKKDHRDKFIQQYITLADVGIPVNFLRCGSDELFVGRAGYLCGALLLNKKFKTQVVPSSKIEAVCASIIQSGREYAKRHQSPAPLMYAYYKTEYLGAAHGLSAILQMLLGFPEYLTANPDAERDVRQTVDFMLSLQTSSGNFPCAMDEVAIHRPEPEELVHWCHGAPGVVYLMARAYRVWHDEKYLNACLHCGECVWKKGLLRKGPGICHGVAGSGYVFLLLYRLTADHKHLHRAQQFANFIFTEEFSKARTPDCPYSLYEGLAGTACFLADLLQPDSSEFPFFDIF
ncbi:lanC-like protein 3 [Limulus polyphemus]|uniref:LanC-like protein 3 n=1 Tax=Limulus polyphemus TaxID=6850 RepID=A0ABM1B7F1_LIMPO|nr:lanC-like protein 3 [Limulus polyphemus]